MRKISSAGRVDFYVLSSKPFSVLTSDGSPKSELNLPETNTKVCKNLWFFVQLRPPEHGVSSRNYFIYTRISRIIPNRLIYIAHAFRQMEPDLNFSVTENSIGKNFGALILSPHKSAKVTFLTCGRQLVSHVFGWAADIRWRDVNYGWWWGL